MGTVRSVAFSPDGKLLSSGCLDKTVRLWDIQEQKQIGLLEHTDDVVSVAFSPDGKLLASGSRDKAVCLWDVKRQKQVGLLQGHKDSVTSVAFSRNGKWLASGSWDCTVLLWEVNLPSPFVVEPKGKQPVTWGMVKCTALYQNYPNPFNPETWIPYQLALDADVTINIYNITGQIVRTLHLGHQRAGVYMTKEQAAYWNGKDNLGQPVASGIYYYTMLAGKFKAVKKMVILR